MEATLEETAPDWHWNVKSCEANASGHGHTCIGTLDVFRVSRGKFDGVGWSADPFHAALDALKQAAALADVDVSEHVAAAKLLRGLDD